MSTRSTGPLRHTRGATALGVIAILLGVGAVAVAPVSADPGSVYTTDLHGSNNQNTHYTAKSDVYLTAGACKGGSRLDDGAYYFEVTDPSTKQLLSTDALADRRFEVSGGVVSAASRHSVVPSTCGGLVDGLVELMPYADTTSPGGEYKLTIAPVGACSTPTLAACAHPAKKTDAFKVNFDPVVATQVSATQIVVGTNTTVSDAVTVTGDAAEGYPHGTVTVYLCPGTTCSTAGRVVGTFETGKGGGTKGALVATGSVAVAVKDLSVGSYTFHAAYDPATQVAYNPAGDPGANETFRIVAGGGGSPSPSPAPGGGGGGGATPTPTPGGSVAGVTSPPKPTLPPTDLGGARPSTPDMGAIGVFLLVVLVTLTAAGTIFPTHRRGP